MKKLTYLSTAILFATFMSCGGGEASDEGEHNADESMEAVEAASGEMQDMNEAIEEDDADEGENEREISTEELPQGVLDDVNSRYPGSSIEEAEEETAEDGSITYEVELKTEEGKLDVMYSSSGEYIGLENDEDEAGDADMDDEN